MESALFDGADDPDLRLIETLGWTGHDFPRLALHLARLERSAKRLGWACDGAALATLLAQNAPANPARLRLTLDRHGKVGHQFAPLPEAKADWTLGVASTRLNSRDPWLTVKSTRRAKYDQARATLPQGIDECIFLNERDEVCDGTITTLFFDRGQGLRTPPLHCGLLPGVLRAGLAATEEILLARDLPHVRLWVGNSLRGLIPCSFIPA